jgi:hypothetical protein
MLQMAVTMTDSAQRINTSHFIYRFAQEERATVMGVSGSRDRLSLRNGAYSVT